MKKALAMFVRLLIRVFSRYSMREALDYQSAMEYLNGLWPKRDSKLLDCHKRSEVDTDTSLSIIVPLYNSEPYLEELMNTLLNQKTNYRYEVVLVNDGSRDNTEKIIETIRNNNPDIVRVINKSNGGISSARNAGIEISVGKYICLVDHDDEISSEFVERMMSEAFSNDVDLLRCHYRVYKEGKLVVADGCGGYVWGVAYRRNVFSRIMFPENYWYEDMIGLLINSIYDRQAVIEPILYTKHIRKSSASRMLWKKGNVQCLDELYLAKDIVDVYYSIAGNDISVRFYQSILYECTRQMFVRTLFLNVKQRKSVYVCSKHIIEELSNTQLYEELDDFHKRYIDDFKKNNFLNWQLRSLYEYLIT